jgi:hypothetical protein
LLVLPRWCFNRQRQLQLLPPMIVAMCSELGVARGTPRAVPGARWTGPGVDAPGTEPGAARAWSEHDATVGCALCPSGLTMRASVSSKRRPAMLDAVRQIPQQWRPTSAPADPCPATTTRPNATRPRPAALATLCAQGARTLQATTPVPPSASTDSWCALD